MGVMYGVCDVYGILVCDVCVTCVVCKVCIGSVQFCMVCVCV